MATEHQQPDAQISTGPPPTTTIPAIPSPDPLQIDNSAAAPIAAAIPPKRQRRPSVRLGEIGGDPPYDPHQRLPSKTWRFHKDPSVAAKTSKTRPLTNLVNGGGGGGGGDSNFVDAAELSENYANFNNRKPKIKKPPKRARTNWNKFDSANNNGGGGGGGAIESANLSRKEAENGNDDSRELEGEGSESPLLREQQSPNNSEENMGLQFWDQHRRGSRARVSDSNGPHLHEGNSMEKNVGSTGVREWLVGLGLSRYAPVFEIHEVDDEVLPLLTMEDLKDMGINAVGSRRKMYSAILKLQKGFS